MQDNLNINVQSLNQKLNIGGQIDAITDRLKLNLNRGVYKQVHEVSTESVTRKLEAEDGRELSLSVAAAR